MSRKISRIQMQANFFIDSKDENDVWIVSNTITPLGRDTSSLYNMIRKELGIPELTDDVKPFQPFIYSGSEDDENVKFTSMFFNYLTYGRFKDAVCRVLFSDIDDKWTLDEIRHVAQAHMKVLNKFVGDKITSYELVTHYPRGDEATFGN